MNRTLGKQEDRERSEALCFRAFLLMVLLWSVARGQAQARSGGSALAQVPLAPTAAALSAGADAMRRGDFAVAAQEFQTATRLQPKFAEAHLNLGLALEEQGHYADSIAALETARRLKPGLRGANLFLGIAEYQINALPKAEEALKRELASDANNAKALMWLGVVQMAEDRPQDAIVPLDRAALLAPKDSDVLYHRGRAHLLLSKASYEQMFAVEPDSFRVHEVLGQADVEAGHTADAITEYKLAVERAPRHAGLHEELGDLYWAAGSTTLADEAYQQELSIDPYSFPSTYKLGSLRVTVGKSEAALPLLRRAVELDPAYPNTYYYLGRAQTDLGQNDAGIVNLQRAATAPGETTLNTFALYQLSRVYRRLHRNEEAAAALKQFQQLRDQAAQQQSARHGNGTQDRRQLPHDELIPSDPTPSPEE